jgi:hypothetical protein
MRLPGRAGLWSGSCSNMARNHRVSHEDAIIPQALARRGRGNLPLPYGDEHDWWDNQRFAADDRYIVRINRANLYQDG